MLNILGLEKHTFPAVLAFLHVHTHRPPTRGVKRRILKWTRNVLEEEAGSISIIVSCAFGLCSASFTAPWGFKGKESACNAGDPGLIPGLGRSLVKKMKTRSSILAWEISWTEESGGLQPVGSQRVRHNLAAEHTMSVR